MRHNLCRSFHPWCPGVKNRCLLHILGLCYAIPLFLLCVLLPYFAKLQSGFNIMFNIMRQNGNHLTDDIFKLIFYYEKLLWYISLKFVPKGPTSTPIHARAWKKKALAGNNFQQIPTNNNIHKMFIIIISLRWKHFVIISYLYKIPTINEPYNQRKRDIRQTHTDILTA